MVIIPVMSEVSHTSSEIDKKTDILT